MEYSPGQNKDPGELVIFQRSCLPSSRINCPQHKEVKWDSKGMKKELPTKLSYKKEACKRWKQG